ncbi:MAG: response regulator transcription factor [Bdellovibrionales bacterium]|jgi:DNA-binding response OmpR family regulator|nr:response regulator transcription factor [Bdellovibrionales bacterium]
MANLLLIDDSEDVRNMVTALLGREHQVSWAGTLADARKALAEKKRFDLVLLDVDLPDGNGVDFLGSGLQEDTAVILLTAYDSVNTRVRGFTFGAEDFIAKPFDPVEFQVRVTSRLRHLARRESAGTTRPNLRAGLLELDLEKQRAFDLRSENGAPQRKELDLTPVEFRLLSLFIRENGAIVPRELILSHVWGDQIHVSPRVVDHHVCSVRRKIAETGTKIESVYGVGYKLEAA